MAGNERILLNGPKIGSPRERKILQDTITVFDYVLESLYPLQNPRSRIIKAGDRNGRDHAYQI